MSDKPTGLALLREKFPDNQISYLPKGGVKLAYVGHAALTDRLLDADPSWNWEPLAISPDGLPVLDPYGGMWIRLTVCGVTRLGYGHAGSKEGGDAIKEIIGDAIRNAAMRFGAALALWHKGELHVEEPEKKLMPPEVIADWIASFSSCASYEELKGQVVDALKSAKTAGDRIAYEAIHTAGEKRKAQLLKEAA